MGARYLFVARDEGETFVSIKTSQDILSYLDMTDCFEFEEVHVYDVGAIGRVEELALHGTWHDPSRPLYMKATGDDGRVVFEGYGTDH